MELRRYLKLFRRWWILIVVTTVVGCVIGYVSSSHKSVYRASAVIYVGHRQPDQDPLQMYQIDGFNQVLETYAAMIPSGVFAQKAVASAGVPRSAGVVAAETTAALITGTNLITVTVTDPNPVVAQKLADGMGQAFVQQVQSTQQPGPGQSGVVPQEPAYLFQTAGVPSAPVGTGVKRKVLLGAVFGFIVALLLVLLIDYASRKPEDEVLESGPGPAGSPGPSRAPGERAGPTADNGLEEQQARSGR